MFSDETIRRFWAKVERTDTCWLWRASKRAKGYGAFVWAVNGNVVQGRAHRFAWELVHGPIPAGKYVLHRCDTPACVRIEHLFLGTKADNNADMRAKGRSVPGGTYGGEYPRGVAHHGAKLCDDAVRQIRHRYAKGESMAVIATDMRVGISAVHRVIQRKTWSHIN